MAKLKFKNDSSVKSPTFMVKFEDLKSKTCDSKLAGIVDVESVQQINCQKWSTQNIKETEKRVRPKSAGCFRNVSPFLSERKKRSKSCCSFSNEQKQEQKLNIKKITTGKRLFQIKNISNVSNDKDFCQLKMNSPFCCCSRDSHYSGSNEIHCFCVPLSGHFPKRFCHNTPSFSEDKTKKISKIYNDTNLWNYKRSLKLLGFKPSDFGIQSGVRSGKFIARKCHPHSSLSTKIISRSYSLDCLRETIKEAWMEDRINKFHRKILAQAAYEEWYLKKEREFLKRLQETKLKEVVNKENLQKNLKNKEEKAKQEFRKWIQRKKIKLKEKSDFSKQANIDKNKVTRRKTPEEIEIVFLKWKKEKDLKLLNRNKEKKKKEEKIRVEVEKQKKEQKVLAEKAYQQWKSKMEEKIKSEMRKNLKKKELQKSESEKKMLREKESQSSFEIWKAIKDQQIQKRMQYNKIIAKMEKEKREAILEERLYEADQAFEEWLIKIDLRNEKQNCKTKIQYNKLPWLPL